MWAVCFRQRRKPKHHNGVAQSQDLITFLPIQDSVDFTEGELEDVLDPWEEIRDLLDPEGYAERVRKSTFPDETFHVPKEKELRLYGEYLTNRLVLEAWARIREERLRI